MIGGWLLIYAAEVGIMSNLNFTQFKAPNGRLLSLPAGASLHLLRAGCWARSPYESFIARSLANDKRFVTANPFATDSIH